MQKDFDDHNFSYSFYIEKGKPIALAEKQNSTVRIPINRIPTTEDAVDQHRQLGGRLKNFSKFGVDPLTNFEELQNHREALYYEKFGSEEKIFTDLINGGKLLRDAVLFFLQLSKDL